MHSDCLGDQIFDLRKDRTLLIGAVERLSPYDLSRNEPSINQLSYLALDRPESYVGIAGKLTEIERFSDMAI
jgi:hypothetical protein